MILPFSTQINGQPSYFINKIWNGLIDNNIATNYNEYFLKIPKAQSVGYTAGLSFKPKIHTIREDKNDRWETGRLIHFTINNRTKDSFRFAPVIPVLSTQKIFISYYHGCLEMGIANGPSLRFLDKVQKEILISNDGLSIEEFIHFFFPEGKGTFIGKIIHWTDFKY